MSVASRTFPPVRLDVYPKIRLPHEEDPFRPDDTRIVREWRVGSFAYIEIEHKPTGILATGSDRRKYRALLDAMKEIAQWCAGDPDARSWKVGCLQM